MQDRTIIALCVSFSLAGLAALAILSETVELPETNAAKFLDDGRYRISGVIQKVERGEGITNAQLSSRCNMGIVMFGDEMISEGDGVSVLGHLTQYKNRTELVSEEIRAANISDCMNE